MFLFFKWNPCLYKLCSNVESIDVFSRNEMKCNHKKQCALLQQSEAVWKPSNVLFYESHTLIHYGAVIQIGSDFPQSFASPPTSCVLAQHCHWMIDNMNHTKIKHSTLEQHFIEGYKHWQLWKMFRVDSVCWFPSLST